MVNGFGGDGGGILTGSKPVEMIHSTVVGNRASATGGGLAANASITVQNTIVSENTDVTGFPDAVGSITNNGGNFIGPGASLAPLGNYGGPTQTMPPLAGSPVLDTANPDVLENDQRGTLRNDPLGDDVGAVERDEEVSTFLTRIDRMATPFEPGESNTNAIVAAAAGTYSGLMTNVSTGKHNGRISVKLTDSGALTVSVWNSAYGAPLRFRLQLEADGQVSGRINLRGVDYSYNFVLLQTTGGQGAYRLRGWVDSFGANISSQINLDRMGYHRRDNPAPMAGKYTSLLPATDDQNAPQGDGYGLVDVRSDGRVRFSGALGDGTRFTISGFVSEDRQWLLFKDLYRTRPQGQHRRPRGIRGQARDQRLQRRPDLDENGRSAGKTLPGRIHDHGTGHRRLAL